MNKIFTSHTVSNQSGTSINEANLLSGLRANHSSAFSTLYDQYASVLLGVITKIIGDTNEAIPLLETTFRKIRSQIDQFRPEKQNLFVWVLSIARCTAHDALEKRTTIKITDVQLTTSGRIITSTSVTNHVTTISSDPANYFLKELVDAVLFKNCLPEEAAISLGLPPELARQQLRLAMQQVRLSQKA